MIFVFCYSGEVYTTLESGDDTPEILAQIVKESGARGVVRVEDGYDLIAPEGWKPWYAEEAA